MPSTCTISGNLQELTGSAIAGFAVFRLVNFGDNIPRIMGSAVLATPVLRLQADTAGVVSGTIWGNDNIDPAGTFYTLTVEDDFQQPIQSYNFLITGATFNLNSATPISVAPVVTPPTGDTTYLRVDAGNTNLTGLNAFTFAIINNIRYAQAFGSSTGLGGKVASAIASLPATGGTVDARSLEGNQASSSDPFAGVTKPVTVLLGACNITTASTWTIPSNVRVIGLGGESGATTLTYTGTSQAVLISSSNNPGLEGIAIVAASASDGLKLNNVTFGKFRDIAISGAPTRGLYITSDGSGTAYNDFSNILVDTAITPLKLDHSGFGFVNDNRFENLVLRTSTDPGTLAILNSVLDNSFYDCDASNYGTNAANKSWDIQGSCSANNWYGGLIDTAANNTGVTFDPASSSNAFIGINNQAGTEVSGLTSDNIYFSTNKFNIRPVSNVIQARTAGTNLGLSGTRFGIVYGTTFDGITANLVNGLPYYRSIPTDITLSNGLNSDITISGPVSSIRIKGPSAPFSIGGFTAGSDGLILYVFNSTTQQMTVVEEDISSSATNRINTLQSADLALRSGTSFVTLMWSAFLSRWVVVSYN